MPHADFVHLRVHSAYSLSEGAIKIKELVGICKKLQMPAVAVTDTGNLFGALEFAFAAKDYGIQPIIGTILSITRAETESGARVGGPAIADPDCLVLLAQNERGYENLMALTSRAYLETEQGLAPQLALEALEGHTEGVIALTGGPKGPVGRLLLAEHPERALATLRTLKTLFPGRLYVELMRHGMEDEDRIEAGLIDLAYQEDVPLVATNDCFFAGEDMYEAHDALLCIADGTYVVEANRRRVTRDHRFRSAEEMRRLFADLPEAVDNTLVIARRCAVMPKKRNPILPTFPSEAGRTEAEELRTQAHDGLKARLEAHVYTPEMTAEERETVREKYTARLDYELDVIEKMGFPGYFLIVSDFIKWSKAHDIPVGPGRGSGAGSVVAWVLTITDLDPLRFGLLFERFLNPERVSMPDFDIDFCQDRRDEVITYVRDKYGHDRVAQIITFGKLQARAVLRDVGRVLQMPYGQVDRICKLVPNNPANPVTLVQAIDGEPALQQERDNDPAVRHLIDLAMKLEGLYRHASTHAAGVVIGDRPLHELVALYRDPRSPIPATQFNMKYVEQAGLVKFDFLGLKTLTVLRVAENLIKASGVDIDLAHIPLDDGPTYAMLGRAEATGVFQLESSGMRDVLRRMKPNRIGDIIALVALYRPGPMDNIPTFIEVKNGTKAPDYLHPSLQPILEETYGIMVYQEQVMQVAQTLAGYSLGGADLLRRAMGKKIKAEMDAQKATFVEGAVARGVPAGQASTIFDQVEKFAGYGFNKSHAAAYAIVAYQTAYLKANHPVEFLAASMTLDLGNTDKLNVFRQELTRLKIKLLIPDINKSEAVFAVETLPDGSKAIRYALGAIKGVGPEAMRSLVQEREKGGPFKDLFDLARRLDLKLMNKRQLENLARAGAFDSIERNRARVVASFETLLRYAHTMAAERESGQIGLFGGPAGGGLSAPPLPTIPDWDSMERLRQEFDAVGFYLSAHPLDTYNTKRLGSVRSAEIGQKMRMGHTQLRLAGILMAKREMTTKTGNRMCFGTFSDASGVFEVTFFAETLATARQLLEVGAALAMAVEIQSRGEELRLTALSVEPIDQALARSAARFIIYVDGVQAIQPLHGLLDREGQGRCKVNLQLLLSPTEEVEIELPGAYAVGGRAKAALKSVPGVLSVEEF